MKYLPGAIAVAVLMFSLPGMAENKEIDTGVAKPDPELEVAEAVYNYMLLSKEFDFESVSLYFLSFVGDKDVPIAVFANLSHSAKTIANLSDSTISDSAVYGRTTGERGVILKIREIHFIDDQRAKVIGGYYEGSMSFSGDTFNLRLCNGRWVVDSHTVDVIG